MSNKFSHLGTIGLLYGGVSAERNVSLASGQAVAAACKKIGIAPVMVDLNENAIEQIQASNIDTAFILLHGGVGEDGRLQALLKFMGIAYTGSGMQASVLAMNKFIAKQIWQSMALPTAPFVELKTAEDALASINELGEVMVKPAHEGSSIGMSIALNQEEVIAAFEEAKKYDASVFAEKMLTGDEYTVAILNGEVLPAIQLKTTHTFYDYDAKYNADDTQYICPCPLSVEDEKTLKYLTKKAFDSLGCEGWGRVDFMRDENGRFNILEVNTVPGMTDHSLVPKAAAAAGYSFENLVETILLSVNING